MKEFNDIFKTILTGDKESSRQAARDVRKLVYNFKDKTDYNQIKDIVNCAPSIYHKIREDWRQENFAVAISVLYFLHDREQPPDFLFFWLSGLLQHERGNIRQAAVRMIQNELGPLTYHIRCPGRKSDFHLFSSKEADDVLFGLYKTLMGLLRVYYKPSYGRCKYISSLPTGVYKSVQLVMARMREDCGEKYISNLNIEEPLRE